MFLSGQSECLQCPQSESFVQSNSFQRLALTSVFDCNRVHRSNWNLQVINLQKYLLNFDCCRKFFESLLPTSNTRNLSPPPHSHIMAEIVETTFVVCRFSDIRKEATLLQVVLLSEQLFNLFTKKCTQKDY